MSTRIYEGFRLATDSLAEALRVVNAFRPWVTTQGEKLLDAFMENLTKNGVDAGQAYVSWQDLRNRVRTEQRRIVHVDTDFSVVLIPADGAILGVCHTEHPEWFHAWCKQEGVEEYGFWDNAPPLEGVTEAQWDAREKAWEVLSGKPVCMQGFSIDLVSPHGPVLKAWREKLA